MRKKTQISQEDFDNLLGWFSTDPDEAGKKYEEVRTGLIKYFYFRGCPESESLADETINRVAGKLVNFTKDGNFKLMTYFYSFASKIFLEDYSERKRIAAKIEIIEKQYQKKVYLEKKSNPAINCLEKCLAKHPDDERLLLLKYYSLEGREKMELRKKMAKEQEINMGLLHTKISRLKKIVRECLKNCLNDKRT